MPAQGILVRLYVGITEDDRTPETVREAAEMTSAYFDAATLFDGYGLWEGQIESVLVIEIATSGQGKVELARMLADDLRKRFEQESVLLTVQDLNEYELVE